METMTANTIGGWKCGKEIAINVTAAPQEQMMSDWPKYPWQIGRKELEKEESTIERIKEKNETDEEKLKISRAASNAGMKAQMPAK